MKTKFLIGTSGWSYSHWKGNFYPQNLNSAKFLDYYQTQFNTVEINSSFYHLPKQITFQNWYQKTAKNFIFSIKASKFITHTKRLKNCREPLNLFLERTKILKEKLGPILFQLPPMFKMNSQRLKEFLIMLSKTHQYAFEFRHPSWFSPEIYELLKKHNTALTIADTPHYPCVEKITADFCYLRFHGHQAIYASNYSNQELKIWQEKIKKWLKKFNLKQVYTYFDNDAHGFAPFNAHTLEKFLQYN